MTNPLSSLLLLIPLHGGRSSSARQSWVRRGQLGYIAFIGFILVAAAVAYLRGMTTS